MGRACRSPSRRDAVRSAAGKVLNEALAIGLEGASARVPSGPPALPAERVPLHRPRWGPPGRDEPIARKSGCRRRRTPLPLPRRSRSGAGIFRFSDSKPATTAVGRAVSFGTGGTSPHTSTETRRADAAPKPISHGVKPPHRGRRRTPLRSAPITPTRTPRAAPGPDAQVTRCDGARPVPRGERIVRSP